MDAKNQILKYLNDTYSIRNILENFLPLNPDEPGAGKSVLAPWSISSISINTGFSEDAVLEELEEIPDAKVEPIVKDGVQLMVLRMRESLGVQAHASHDSHDIKTMMVKDAMNLHLYQFSIEKVAQNDRPVKIEEAIFDLKNNAFLPDDFMPEHMMGMVEGDLAMSTEGIHRAFLLNSDVRILYLFHELKGNSAGRVRFIYPAKANFSVPIPENGRIREILAASFSGLRENEKYKDFENSRLLKTVLYNLETKNSRELKRPAFDPRKIRILETLGLVEKTGDAAMIRDSVSAGQLKTNYNMMKKHGEELANEWLHSKVDLVQ